MSELTAKDASGRERIKHTLDALMAQKKVA